MVKKEYTAVTEFFSNPLFPLCAVELSAFPFYAVAVVSKFSGHYIVRCFMANGKGI